MVCTVDTLVPLPSRACDDGLVRRRLSNDDILTCPSPCRSSAVDSAAPRRVQFYDIATQPPSAKTDSETVMVDLAFGDGLFEQDQSWDDFGTIIPGIQGNHQNYTGSRMPISLMVPGFNRILGQFL